jgi:hypothetical protein
MWNEATKDNSLSSPAPKDAKALNIVLWTLAALSLIFSLWVTTVGWHNSIFDFHGFRQAQTAISVESILNGGPILRYETPVLGPPWSVPFEFPLYQVLVALLTKIFGTPIDQTGRFISEVFRYLCFFPLATILAHLGLTRVQRLPALALFAASPFYNFASHLFMIESMALFFSLMYLDQIMRLVQSQQRDRRRLWYIAGATTFGVLAGLVKVTTLAAFFILAGCMLLWHFWGEYKHERLKMGPTFAVGALCLGVPIVITAIWTRFADAVKAQNPIGVHLTSKALQQWNFGTLAQRMHPGNYLPFADAINTMVGSIALALVALVVAFFLCRRWLWLALISIALYLVAIEIFFNLHWQHEYYAYANGIFVVAAIGIVLGPMMGLPGKKACVGLTLLIALLATCGIRYVRRYYYMQQANHMQRLRTAQIVDQTTKPDDVILMTGWDWSSEFPYMSHRRAVMAPILPGLSDGVDQAIRNEGPNRIAAMVVCSKGRSEARLPELLRELGMPNSTSMHADDCDIYERIGSQEDTESTPSAK